MKYKNPMLSKYMKNCREVAVDFDGTLTLDGETLDKRASKYINKLSKLGITFLLWTCRCEDRYDYAVDKVLEWGLPIQVTLPEEPRKISCFYYIDDRSVPGGKIKWYRTYLYIKKEFKKLQKGSM